MYILIYVDDILVASQKESNIVRVEKLLSSNFDINNLGKAKHYLSLEIFQDKNTSVINSRPDIAASILILARKVSSPTQEDWSELKRVLKYLKGTQNYFLRLSHNHVKSNKLVGYADANWAEDRIDRKSNSGFVFQINCGKISWSCRKQTIVALSTTEAEFVALSEACKEGIWIKQLLDDMYLPQNYPTIIYEDNQSCLYMIKEQKLSSRTKHIDTKLHFVKDHIDNGCCSNPTELPNQPLSQNLRVQNYTFVWDIANFATNILDFCCFKLGNLAFKVT